MRQIEKLLSIAALRIYKGFIVEKDIDPASIDYSSVKNILFVVRHQMGDMLCATPMMRSVRTFFSEAKIILVTKKSTNFEEIFKNNNSPVDEVKYYEHGIEDFLNLAKELKDKHIDLAIVPSTVVFSATNHLIAHLSEAKLKVGVKSKDYEVNPTSYMLNVKKDYTWDINKIHQIERNLDIIRQLNVNPLDTKITLNLREENKKFAEEFFRKNFSDTNRSVIGFHPGAGKEGNVWNPEKFAELASMLKNKYGSYIFISEGPSDTKYVSEVERILREKYNITDYIKHNGELMNNTAIISMLSLFITNDTGVMHLASGFDLPIIALFGPTKAYEWGPVKSNQLSIQAINGNISNIDVNKVYETCMSVLSVKYAKK